MNSSRGATLEKWIETSQPAIEMVYSMLLARTNLASHEAMSIPNIDLELMVHSYGFSWIIGFFFFAILAPTSLFRLKNYYVTVSLPKYSQEKPLVDFVAWKWGGILGCWAGAAYGGELASILPRTLFSSIFIPLMNYFVLAFAASLLAYFRYRRQCAPDPLRQ